MQLVSHDAAIERLANLDLGSVALLLDVDGTLIDIGPTPEEVFVPDGLRESLVRLTERTDGALALVSGRLIAHLDKLFDPLKLTAVGGHGAEMRIQGGAVIGRIKPLPEGLRQWLAAGAQQGSGVLVEDKGYSVALHFRKAPEQEQRLRELIDAGCAAFPDERLEVLPGKAMLEVKRGAVNKGVGIRRLMSHAPFKGRCPIFIGDDVTDEAAFSVMPELGGLAFSVDLPFDGLAGEFRSPADVRLALSYLAENKAEHAHQRA